MTTDPSTVLAELSDYELEKLRDLIDAEEARREEAQPAVPFVAIGHGERAPWAHLPRTCPTCGEEDLPLIDSNPPGLTAIKHCGKTWLRGEMRL